MQGQSKFGLFFFLGKSLLSFQPMKSQAEKAAARKKRFAKDFKMLDTKNEEQTKRSEINSRPSRKTSQDFFTFIFECEQIEEAKRNQN